MAPNYNKLSIQQIELLIAHLANNLGEDTPALKLSGRQIAVQDGIGVF
jgi:hypothetical protein